MDRCLSISVQQLWENKEIELTVKYGANKVAMFWPYFNSVDSALFVKRTHLFLSNQQALKVMFDHLLLVLSVFFHF